jgi:hypothetical protein
VTSRRRLVAFACGASALIGASPTAAVAAPPRIDVKAQQLTPKGYMAVSWLNVGGRAGRRSEAGRLLVRNAERRPVRVTIDPVRGLTARNLGSAYEVRSPRPSRSARWTRLSARRLTIPARSTRAIDLSFAVPGNARPGEYLSGVAVEARGARSKPTAAARVAVASTMRFVVGTQVNLPGARRPHITLDDVRVERYPAGVTFVARARNDGNTILTDVKGEIVARRHGRTVLRQPIGPGAFISNTELNWDALAPKERPAEGTDYDVTAVLRYNGGVARTTKTVTFGKRQAKTQREYTAPTPGAAARGSGVLPIAIGGGAGALLLAALLAAAARRRRVRPLTADAGMRRLEREMATASDRRPISVILIAPIEDAVIDTRTVGRQVRPRVRSTDVLSELRDNALLVIAPDTSARAAEGLAEDIGRFLTAEGDGVRVTVATATSSEMMPEELLARADRTAEAVPA